MNKNKNVESLIIAWDRSKGKDHTVMLVGRKEPNENVRVVNMFTGDDAEAFYDMLTTTKLGTRV